MSFFGTTKYIVTLNKYRLKQNGKSNKFIKSVTTIVSASSKEAAMEIAQEKFNQYNWYADIWYEPIRVKQLE